MKSLMNFLKGLFQGASPVPVLKLSWILQFDGNRDAPYANCWALTMLIWNGIEEPRWIKDDECDAWLNKNTRRIDGEPIAGDILVMRGDWYGRKNVLHHTAVYLGNGRYWHKPGSDIGEYASLERIQTIYRNTTQYYVRVKGAHKLDIAKAIDSELRMPLNKAA